MATNLEIEIEMAKMQERIRQLEECLGSLLLKQMFAELNVMVVEI